MRAHMWKTAALGLAFGIAASAPAFAHHSGAMFDSSKRVKLEGTIKSFEWTNPHSRIWFLADTVDGKKQPAPVLWAIETGSPGQLTRMGWTKRTLNPGDKVSMAVAPLRSGEPAGLGIRPQLLNGKPFPVKAGKEDLERPNLDVPLQ